MGQHMTNIDFMPIEMNDDNQPIFITADIKNDPFTNFISGGEDGTQVIEILKFSLVNDFEPTAQRAFAVRMFFPELLEGFARDDMHALILSQTEI